LIKLTIEKKNEYFLNKLGKNMGLINNFGRSFDHKFVSSPVKKDLKYWARTLDDIPFDMIEKYVRKKKLDNLKK